MSYPSTSPAAVTAVAHPNIALIKYGEARREVHPSCADSLSLTLDIFPTTTAVELIDASQDRATINGVNAAGEPRQRIEYFLDIARSMAAETVAISRSIQVFSSSGTGAKLDSRPRRGYTGKSQASGRPTVR